MNQWSSKTVSFGDLEGELNAFSVQGCEIFSLIPVHNTHVVIVAVKREPAADDAMPAFELPEALSKKRRSK